MLDDYRTHIHERHELGIPPQPLNATQVAGLLHTAELAPAGDEAFIRELITHHVAPGVNEAARLKAAFLADLASGRATSSLFSPGQATTLLGTMLGGYNVAPLIALLDDDNVAPIAARALGSTLLMFDAFHDVVGAADSGNAHAREVLRSWAEARWFHDRPEVPDEIQYVVFKVPGEINTDELSPADDAWSRADVPLHALSMLKRPRPGMSKAIEQINQLKDTGHEVAFVSDIVGTGSSRKSATNSLLWHIGKDVPYVPNRRRGGLILAHQIAPIFFNTAEDAGALPVECAVDSLSTGDVITVRPYAGETLNAAGDIVSRFELKHGVLLDEVQAGGRISLIIGRGLTQRARDALGMQAASSFRSPVSHGRPGTGGHTLAQKIVGRACGVRGVEPGAYCEPRVSTVGSQDTTGPMTRDELEELACLGFQADLVLQTFCHTAAYPKPADIDTQTTLPGFMNDRGGVSLRPGDGIIHSWMNRMLLPDQVGTGADSHTRFPLGISFPAGSGMVAFAATLGVMPIDMPESVLVRFTGAMQPGITLRDLVNAIPYAARQQGQLTVGNDTRTNVFSGRIMEIAGLPDLTVEQAFELSDSSAERSAAGCTIELSCESVSNYLRSNVVMLRWMIANGYGDAHTIERRAQAMEDWLGNPKLLRADEDADYSAVITVDMSRITQPLLACPNDPDDIRPLGELTGQPVDEVFIGSCMTNIGHFRAAGKLFGAVAGQLPTRIWIAPPTKMDARQLIKEGVYETFATVGARTEVPGCSLCMGNQARVAAQATVVSTSTRNFPNRLGPGADVFLASAELTAISAILGRLPTLDEYRRHMTVVEAIGEDIYRYTQFDQMPDFVLADAGHASG